MRNFTDYDEFLEKSLEQFFSVAKTSFWRQFDVILTVFGQNDKNDVKYKKIRLDKFFGIKMSPTSCQVSEKLLERFPRNCRDRRTDGGDSIRPFGFQPGTNNIDDF